MLLNKKPLWMAAALAVVLLAALPGCSRRSSAGEATARTVSIDASLSQEAVHVLDSGKIVVPPGAKVEISESYAKQPNPPDTSASVVAKADEAVANTGDAGEISATLGGLNILYWIGSACIVFGVIVLAATRYLIGIKFPLPWWTGPAISLSGVAMIFLPRVVEVAAGPLVSIGLTFTVVCLLAALWIAWRRRERLLGDLNGDGVIS